MPADLLLEVKNLVTEVRSFRHLYDLRSMDETKMHDTISMLTTDPRQNARMLQEMGPDAMFDEAPCSYDGLVKSEFEVGIEINIWNLKRILFQRDVSVVGVHGMGGIGKTTTALALCNDQQIKGLFQNNIIFLTISQSPNLKVILETMWEKIVHTKCPEFQNIEDAHRQLQQQLKRKSKPTLVVLDDVWSKANLEMLLFEGEGYKTLVTTRNCSTILQTTSTQLYELSLLDDVAALSLFCFWAFGQRSIPSTADEQLVKQVQAGCKGLPLALKVIGSSLHGMPPPVWESAKKKILNGEPISDYHKEGLLKCLKTSIDVLDEEARECFLDLGLFLEDRKVSISVLLDIWVYVRKMDWNDAFSILLELASRNLLNLTSTLRSQAIKYGGVDELYFSQHDVMRDLAIYLSSQDNIAHKKRLLMPKIEHNFRGKWELLKNQACDAQILSIHIGVQEEKQWRGMNFDDAEALVLLFSTSNYHIPSFLSSMRKLKVLIILNYHIPLFLSSMRKLKVLIILNYGPKRATVNGLMALSSLTQLKTIHLERLIVPLYQEHNNVLQNLEKLSLSLCEGIGNMSRFSNAQWSLNLPVMVDFNLDYCCDLEELPPRICDMTSVKKLSITNCHLLQKLPDDLGNLFSLRMLVLYACVSMKELPTSIGKLEKLEYLDISLCQSLKKLPHEIGQLRKLEEIDMRECSQISELPESIGGMRSLKHVICDENIGKKWMHVKNSIIMDLKVDVVEEQFSLDWLDG